MSLGRCHSIALEAVPLVQLCNTSLHWFIVKYHNAEGSRYDNVAKWNRPPCMQSFDAEKLDMYIGS